jgi:hypothetical protein
MMQTLWQDLRYGARMLMKQPGFTLIAVLTLALGIGTNTAIFGIFSSVLLRPLPFPNAEQLVVAQGHPWAPVAHFTAWREGQQSASHLAAYYPREYHLASSSETELIEGAEITSDFFPLLGVAPQFGRNLLAEEDQPGRQRVALVSAGLWRRRFGEAQFNNQTVRLRLSRAAWPYLQARRGSIVNIAGIGGRTGSADFTIGGAVNSALLNLTKALADRGVVDGVRVNAINPGSIVTDRLKLRLRTLAAEQGVDEAEAERAMTMASRVARFGEPAEIARAVAFLASPQADYLQGALLDIDGGQTRTL